MSARCSKGHPADVEVLACSDCLLIAVRHLATAVKTLAPRQVRKGVDIDHFWSALSAAERMLQIIVEDRP